MNVDDYILEISNNYKILSGLGESQVTVKAVQRKTLDSDHIYPWWAHVGSITRPKLQQYSEIGHTREDAIANLAEKVRRKVVVDALRLGSELLADHDVRFSARVSWGEISMASDQEGATQVSMSVSPMAVWTWLPEETKSGLLGELWARNQLEAEVNVTSRVLDDVAAERERQDAQHPNVDLPDGTGERGADARAAMMRSVCDLADRVGQLTWRDVLLEEVFEAVAEQEVDRLRAELIQVAAVAVKWVEHLDRREQGTLDSAR